MTKIRFETIYIGLFAIALFAFFVNPVIKTTVLLELICLVNLCVYAAQQKKFSAINGNSFSIVALAALSFLLICLGVLIETEIDSEAYRLLFIPIICLTFCAIRLDYTALMRAIFWLSIIGGIYNIFDVIYFNLFLGGNLSAHFAAAGFASLEDTQYDRLASFFGLFPFFRPFGIFGQPQKSAFIGALGIVSYYFIAQIEQRSLRQWKTYFVFLFLVAAGMVTGGTTGILASVMMLAIIYAGEFGLMVSSGLFFGGLAACFVAVLFVIDHPLYYNAFAKDVSGVFNGDAIHLLVGAGFVSAAELFKEGFGHEHFIFRVIYEIGMLPFLVWTVLLVASIFRRGFKRAGALICVLLFFMVAHYSITNVYFVVLFLCVSICLIPLIPRPAR